MEDFAWKIYNIWSFLFFKEVVDPQKAEACSQKITKKWKLDLPPEPKNYSKTQTKNLKA
jgi:hypothetical protein